MRMFEVASADEMAELWNLISVSVGQALHAQQQEQAKQREAQRASKSGSGGRRSARASVPPAVQPTTAKPTPAPSATTPALSQQQKVKPPKRTAAVVRPIASLPPIRAKGSTQPTTQPTATVAGSKSLNPRQNTGNWRQKL